MHRKSLCLLLDEPLRKFTYHPMTLSEIFETAKDASTLTSKNLLQLAPPWIWCLIVIQIATSYILIIVLICSLFVVFKLFTLCISHCWSATQDIKIMVAQKLELLNWTHRAIHSTNEESTESIIISRLDNA